MKKIRTSACFSILLFLSSLRAQTIDPGFFIPVEIQKAYAAGTRSMDGKPGPAYWQNHSAYNIKASIDPVNRKLSGAEQVRYTNNSPTPLHQLVVTLIGDILKPNGIRDMEVREDLLNPGVELEYVRINGKEIDLTKGKQARRYGTNLFITLSDPLESGGTLEMDVAWRIPLLPNAGRVGFTDSTTCFVGYWYPKISVYDDIDGWDTYNHRGIMEYYSDLADFDVEVQIPETYAVWATGTLQNAGAVLPDAIRERYETAATATETVAIISAADWEKGLKMNSGSWQYKAENVPDFAFVFSDHYAWEGISLPLGDRRVRINSLYHPESAEYCKNVTTWQRDLMQFFSEKSPGVAYPYPAFTSFYKTVPGGGMEFPMFANNGCPRRDDQMIGLTAHEMHHTYFPFYIDINEKKYAWMDEGWANFMAYRATFALTGQESTKRRQVFLKIGLEKTLGTLENIPLLSPAEYLGPDNYGYSAYDHPAFIYDILAELLGEEIFQKCMRGYMNRWAYKKPTPYDFFFSFNDLSGQDLSWFWKPWFMEFGYADLALGEVTPGKITVHRKGNKPVPVSLTVIYQPGDTLHYRKNAAVWAAGDRDISIALDRKELPQQVFLNVFVTPDWDNSDNYFIARPVLSKDALQAYAGNYTLGEDHEILSVKAGASHLQVTSEDTGYTYVLLPMDKNKFGTMDGTFELNFEQDEKNKVTGYQGSRFGRELTGQRL